MVLRVNRIIKDSSSNGPLTRYTIWVQGCSIRCKGCNNTDTWNPQAGREIPINDIVEDFLASGAEGLTLTGGEPLDQGGPVLALMKMLFPQTSIMLCSGREYEEIAEKFPEAIKHADILLSGPFVQEQYSDKLLWKGSANQKLHFLTPRGQALAGVGHENLAEIRINKRTGEMVTTGFSIPD